MMKLSKVLILFFLILFNSEIYSQGITLKGMVISKEYCQFSEGGGYFVKSSEKVYNTFFRLSDYELVFSGKNRISYKLYDKMVDDDSNQVIIHYFGESRNEVYIVGVRDCEGKIQVAIFPIDGKTTFVQYKIKLIKNKTNGRN